MAQNNNKKRNKIKYKTYTTKYILKKKEEKNSLLKSGKPEMELIHNSLLVT